MVEAKRVWTLADWAALDEDEPGELVDGRLEEEEVPDYLHEMIVGILISALRSWLAPRGGVVGGSDAKFVISPRRGRKPDVSAYLPGSSLPPRRGVVSVPPDIMIEVITPTARDRRRDRVEKLQEYASFGVRFYWILDPEDRTLEIFELAENDRYQVALSASEGKLAVPGCEGLALDLDAIWAEVERLPSSSEST